MFTLLSKLDCTLVLFQRTNLGFDVKFELQTTACQIPAYEQSTELKNGIQKKNINGWNITLK